MATRKTNPLSFVEREWKPFFDGVESGRLRRGKTAAKQGLVTRIRVDDGVVEATVKNAGFNQSKGSVHVRLSAPDNWGKYKDEVAVWFGRRPDWLAGLFLGQWDPEFLDFIKSAGLYLFPTQNSAQRMLEESNCTCLDWEKPCQHVVALAFRIVSEVSLNPMAALSYVGLDISNVLDDSHRFVAQRIASSLSAKKIESASVEVPLEEKVGLWGEERLVYHQLLMHDVEPPAISRIQPIIRVDEVRAKFSLDDL